MSPSETRKMCEACHKAPATETIQDWEALTYQWCAECARIGAAQCQCCKKWFYWKDDVVNGYCPACRGSAIPEAVQIKRALKSVQTYIEKHHLETNLVHEDCAQIWSCFTEIHRVIYHHLEGNEE